MIYFQTVNKVYLYMN